MFGKSHDRPPPIQVCSSYFSLRFHATNILCIQDLPTYKVCVLYVSHVMFRRPNKKQLCTSVTQYSKYPSHRLCCSWSKPMSHDMLGPKEIYFCMLQNHFMSELAKVIKSMLTHEKFSSPWMGAITLSEILTLVVNGVNFGFMPHSSWYVHPCFSFWSILRQPPSVVSVPNDPLLMIQTLDIWSTPCLLYRIFTSCPSSNSAISMCDGLLISLSFLMFMLGSNCTNLNQAEDY